MSEILFPSDLIIELSDLDLEMMSYYSRQWDLENCQMEKGEFSGSLLAVHTPRIQLASAMYSHGFMTKGSIPLGTIVLLYINSPATVTFQNERIDAHELVVIKEGAEIDYLANGINTTFTIAIEEVLFHSFFENYFGDSVDEVLKDKRFRIDALKVTTFLKGISYWSDYLKGEQFRQIVDKSYSTIETAILRHIFSSLSVDGIYREKKKFKIKKAREILDAHINDTINIAQLSYELGISERQLHHAFQSSYGLTPKNYLQNLHLNLTRKELLARDHDKVTVSEIAFKHNFTHMSDFTKKYKQMFGETPSFTLQKPPR